MKKIACFILIAFSFQAFAGNPYSYIRSYFKERKFVIDNDETYKVDVCENEDGDIVKFSIYNWKTGNVPVEEYNWHVGGYDNYAPIIANQIVNG